jgi:hypothetical protein
MHEAEIDQLLRVGGDRRCGEHALHQRIPIADLFLGRPIVALLRRDEWEVVLPELVFEAEAQAVMADQNGS